MRSTGVRIVAWVLALTALFYAVNLAAMLLPYANVEGLAADWVEQVGVRKRTLDSESKFLATGLVTAQTACVVLWMLLSNLKLRYRLPLFVVFLLQVVIVCGIGQSFYPEPDFTMNDYSWTVVAWLGSILALLLFTSVALRLAQRRIEFVKTGSANEGYRWSGLTIVQGIYFVTLIAGVLASHSHLNAIKKFDIATPDQAWMASILWTLASSGITTLLLLTGLSVAIYLEHFWMQIVVGVLLTELLSCMCWLTFPHDWNQLVHVLIWCLGVVVLPIVWLAAVRRMGYVLRCFDRATGSQVEQHPFEESSIERT